VRSVICLHGVLKLKQRMAVTLKTAYLITY
jgi:hypothetical protein